MDTSLFFNDYYNNAKTNSIIIMNDEGTILQVNDSFISNFGYTNEEINGANFSILFNKKDNENNCPANELKAVLATGNANDENYIMHKNGTAIWATGETMLINDKGGKKYFVKDIVNLQERKQFEFFLRETEELLENVFESSKEIAIMILDGALRIIKVNNNFLNLFEIDQFPATGSTLSQFNHHFWNDTLIRQELRNSIVKNEPLKNKDFMLKTAEGEKLIRLNSKLIKKESGNRIFIIIQPI